MTRTIRRSPGDAEAFRKALAAQLPREVAEVLLPVLTLRLSAGRVLAVLPNPAWRDAFALTAETAARTIASAGGRALSLASAVDPGRGAGAGEGGGFDVFLADPGNQLALAACRRVAEAPGLEHNPLYLHGAAGCGKSHLLGAVAQALRSALGEASVFTTTGDAFVAQLAQRLSGDADPALRAAIDGAAAIIIDGLDALDGRPLAQEELFRLINGALERGQQLVFAGGEAPRRLTGLTDRLVTRLGWGLSVAIEPPLPETRLALLRRLAGEHAPDDAALARLVDAYAPDMHQVVRLAERLAAGDVPHADEEAASFDRILQAAAERFGLRPGDITGPRRARAISQARQAVLLLGRRLTGHNLTALGGMVGGRDHSSVLYAIRQAEERAAADRDFARSLEEITRAALG